MTASRTPSPISPRISAIHPSLTLSIAAKARELTARGETVWSFSAGEPDFDTPEHIKAAAIRSLQDGQTKYTAADGLPALQKAIAAKLEAENGLRYRPDQILISGGAKHSIFNAVMALCGEGDEVIVPGPYWLSYPEMISVAGARPVIVAAREEAGFKLTPAEIEAAVTPRTKLLILNSPSNPTGVVYGESELRAIGETAVRHGIWILSDEIYEKLIYGGARHASVGALSPALHERTLTVNGFSKAYSMTGWRLGYCAGPAEVVKAMSALQSHSTSAPCTFVQYGGVEALKASQDCVVRMARAFEERRDRMHERLKAMELPCVKPGGAFYMFPNIGRFGMGSIAFAERLLVERRVAVVPGLPFGSDSHIRLSYACSMDAIERGMDALAQFVASL